MWVSVTHPSTILRSINNAFNVIRRFRDLKVPLVCIPFSKAGVSKLRSVAYMILQIIFKKEISKFHSTLNLQKQISDCENMLFPENLKSFPNTGLLTGSR